MKKFEKYTVKQKKNVVACILVMFVLLFVDQATKAIADAYNMQQPAYFLNLVRIYFTMNPGIAFSLFAENPFMMVVVTVLTAVLIVGMAVLFFTLFRYNLPGQACLAIIEAGAIGNFIDRICLGAVRDFVDVSPLHFGVCNIADFFVTFGAVALIFIILFIGPTALFPLRKKWREEAKRLEDEHIVKAQAAEEAMRRESDVHKDDNNAS